MIKIKTFSFPVFLFCFFSLLTPTILGATDTIVTERPVVLVITSYNNKDWYKRNLGALFSQNYSNYRAVYVDDCSPDGTGDLVEAYVKKMGQEHRVIIVKNKKRVFKMSNFYNAVHQYCNDDEIILDYDGDDWFAHDDVLAKINEAYSNSDVWMTYGTYALYPPGGTTCCDVVPQWVVERNAYRDYRWVTSQQRTCYAWLFKQVRLKDFLHEGAFVEAANDLHYMFPTLEMAGGRFHYIQEILYIYNVASPINIHNQRRRYQLQMDKVSRRRKRYNKLDTQRINWFDQFKNKTASCFIFSHDNPSKLRGLLKSCSTMNGVNNINVFYSASSDVDYDLLISEFPGVQFDCIDKTCKACVLNRINEVQDYIILASDNAAIKDRICVQEAISLLEETGAYSFLLGAVDQSKIRKMVIASNNVMAWSFRYGIGRRACPNNFDMTLYRTSDVENLFKKLNFGSILELEEKMLQPGNTDDLGLFFGDEYEARSCKAYRNLLFACKHSGLF